MHSSVFEVSRTPVPVSKQIRAGHLPDWFYEQICDYAENPSLVQRKNAIGQFCRGLGNLCTQNGDKFTIYPGISMAYFCKRYDCFKTAAKTLAQTDYEVFAGSGTPAFHLALDCLNSSYEDKWGVYIYSTESGELITLDRWLRIEDFSVPFYIGGMVNYHY